jgi:hypothetical protein
VSWSSLKQSSVAQSTIKAEYVTAASCFSQLLWITYTMSGFGESIPMFRFYVTAPMPPVCKEPNAPFQNQSHRSQNHLLRDNIDKGKIAMIHVPTHDQLADIFTKPIDQETFTNLRGGGLVCV